mmetsp:Transcript_24679/g.84406  ORF Transcript_24679/g.84406 Transcript_24679/m.84406 type:complete len:219 (-) Transcript_24679:1535-2191(-)
MSCQFSAASCFRSRPSGRAVSGSCSSAKLYRLSSPAMENFRALSLKLFIFSFMSFVASSPLAMMASTSSSVMVLSLLWNTFSAPKRTMLMRSSLFTVLLASCRRPCWMTIASSASFLYAFSITFTSTLSSVQKRNTCTSFFCPMRCARSIACRSICGFQSLSYRMTVSAVARLMPSPPALVDRRKMNFWLPSRLNAWICASRSPPMVLPSMRQYMYPR